MCDYCDCRSHPQIASLSAEHDELLELLGQLVRAVAGDDRTAAMGIVSRVDAILGDHAHREERGIFAALRSADVASSYIGRFEQEHVVVHDVIGRSTSEDWQQSARTLVGLLAEHIAREETDLFPAAHQLLTPKHWDDVDRAVARAATP